jgi:hypothetical protein
MRASTSEAGSNDAFRPAGTGTMPVSDGAGFARVGPL